MEEKCLELLIDLQDSSKGITYDQKSRYRRRRTELFEIFETLKQQIARQKARADGVIDSGMWVDINKGKYDIETPVLLTVDRVLSNPGEWRIMRDATRKSEEVLMREQRELRILVRQREQKTFLEISMP